MGGVSAWPRWIVGARPRRTLVRTAVLAVVCLVVFGLVLRPVRVSGISMEPTVHDGTFRFGLLTAYAFAEPRVGDIVMVRLAGRRVMYLKRILATPGETAQFRAGGLWVDGALRPEPYVRLAGEWQTDPIPLRAGEYLVAGDNRSAPLDRHMAGVTTRDRIEGRLAW